MKLQDNWGRKERDKEYIYTLSFILGFTTIQWRWTFSWTSKSSRVTQQGVEIYESFLVSCRFGVCPVFVSGEVCLLATVAKWRHNLSLSSGLGETVCYLASTWEKDVRLINVVNAYWERSSLRHREVHLLRHAQTSLPVRGLLGNCFIFLNLFIVFILFLLK